MNGTRFQVLTSNIIKWINRNVTACYLLPFMPVELCIDCDQFVLVGTERYINRYGKISIAQSKTIGYKKVYYVDKKNVFESASWVNYRHHHPSTDNGNVFLVISPKRGRNQVFRAKYNSRKKQFVDIDGMPIIVNFWSYIDNY